MIHIFTGEKTDLENLAGPGSHSLASGGQDCCHVCPPFYFLHLALYLAP